MYSLNRITTITDCDTLLAWANKEKSELTLKKINDEYSVQNYGSTSIEIEAILQGVIAEIAAQESVIAILQEGPSKEEAIRKKTRLEYKRFVLTTRKENYGSVALLEKELDLDRINKELTSVETFITDLTAHRGTLQ
ncbi:hypothetical protein FSS13T_23580 [Flavobacterium saliperosum S13]|uniref:Uncharacterized protein n=2 Tax=Flavobacterium saliperosum TaxID=329186 RepID=A0A1G4VMR1_9FLAO|nr:hypothetical protein [Flavobacterium saliperosum]ESU23627.1 hypothetical protein FSS13T_23580 [Flavobacterium saliperosum S13]SCX09135.1 hypothetical protein SAMN02927925_01335 [Flavobacterium saliperosum]